MLPVRPFTLKKAAKIWGTTEAKAEKLLDHLCEKALMVHSEYKGQRQFIMPPPMAGFIEFAQMRTRGDIDQKYLSELRILLRRPNISVWGHAIAGIGCITRDIPARLTRLGMSV